MSRVVGAGRGIPESGAVAAMVGGRTWWGRKWLDVLSARVDLGGARATRGRQLARDGHVGEIDILPGRVEARVTAGGGTHRTAIDTGVLDDKQWEQLLDAMASRIDMTAELVTGRVPAALPDLEEELGFTLIPDVATVAWSDDGDADDPGRHVIALHHTLAAAMEGDPFVLFALRGRRRDAVLSGLRSRRGTRVGAAPGTVAADEGSIAPARGFLESGDLERVAVHPQESRIPHAVMDRLGPPPRVDRVRPLDDLVDEAAALAWRLASGAGADAADDELLVTELRALRMAGAARVAEALGWDVESARTSLDRLFEEGRILRTGTGDKTRYRAP